MAAHALSAVQDEVPLASGSDQESTLDQLGRSVIDKTANNQNEKAPGSLVQRPSARHDKPGERDLVLDDDSKTKARAVSELWRDADQRRKFAKDANIANEEDLDDMWEATEAWFNHATHPVPENLIEFVDDAIKDRQ